MKTFEVIDLGFVSFEECHRIQKELLEKRIKKEIPDTLILCEHPAVITMGKKNGRKNLLVEEEFLKEKNAGLFSVERGGDVTCHCPGQLVAYPIFDLSGHGKDINKFLDDIEEVIILTLKQYGFDGGKRRGYAGIWINGDTGKEEIGFIGIALTRWVTYHGFSINVNPDLEPFSWIVPCGLDGARVTSMEKLMGKNAYDLSVDKIKINILKNFEKVFNIKVQAVIPNVRSAA
jgi:lipoate-protein ligase B